MRYARCFFHGVCSRARRLQPATRLLNLYWVGCYLAAQGYFPPECDIVSIFLDQCDGQFKMTEAEAIKSLGKGPDDEYAAFTAAGASRSQDNGVSIANAAGIPVCASIRQALCIGGDGKKLNVDGVVLIGEHGDYPADEFGRHMYPRKHLFEQIAGVFAASGRSVPVFNDKHFSYNMEDGALCSAVA